MAVWLRRQTGPSQSGKSLLRNKIQFVFKQEEEKSCLEIYKSEKQLANCQLKLVSNKNGCTLSFCCHDVSFYLLCDFGHKELVRQCILGKKSSYPDHFLMGRRCKIIHSKSNFPVIRF